MPVEHWKEKLGERGLPSAVSYLTLLVGRQSARKMVKALRKQDASRRSAAKDIFRAARPTSARH